MADKKHTKTESENCWVIPPRGKAERVTLGVSLTASARDLTPDFVANLATVVRSVQGIGDLAIGEDGPAEGNCPVLGSCDVNRDRCGVLTICGVNN